MIEIPEQREGALTSNEVRLPRYTLVSIVFVLTIVSGIGLIALYLRFPRSDAYYLAKIPPSLKTNQNVSRRLITRMRNLEQVRGGPISYTVTDVSTVKEIPSLSPNVDNKLMVEILLMEKKGGIYSKLQWTPYIRQFLQPPDALACRFRNVVVVLDK